MNHESWAEHATLGVCGARSFHCILSPDPLLSFPPLQVVLFGVPGAFTPGCSKTHLPGYVAAAADMKAKGVAELVCISVNDPFVMEAWGKAQGADGKVRMLADTTGAYTKALGLDLDLTAALGGVRCKRFSAVVENGVVSKLNVEPADAPTGMTCSLAEKCLV